MSIEGRAIRLWSNRSAAEGTRSLGGNGYERQVLLLARVCEREQHHHEREHALRFQVSVVDPEPVIAVADRDEGVPGPAPGAMNDDEPSRLAFARDTLPTRGDAALG